MVSGIKKYIMILDKNLIEKIKGNFRPSENLSNYSWFNLGGNAEYFYKARDKNQLIEFLAEAKKKKIENNIFRCWL